MRCLYILCFNDTSTTEIYTCLHTLSLHDAIPSLVNCWRLPFFFLYPWRRFFLKTITLSPFKCDKILAETLAPFTVGVPTENFPPSSANNTLSNSILAPSSPCRRCTKSCWSFATLHCCPAIFTIARSEEHTSELQSLIRISYAVFCL